MKRQFCKVFQSISDVDSFSAVDKLNDFLVDNPSKQVVAIDHYVEGSIYGVDRLTVVFEFEEEA